MHIHTHTCTYVNAEETMCSRKAEGQEWNKNNRHTTESSQRQVASSVKHFLVIFLVHSLNGFSVPMRLHINLIDTSIGNIFCPIRQILFLPALPFLHCQSESETRGVAPGGREEGWVKMRGFVSSLPGITSKEGVTRKSPIQGQACWAIAQGCCHITGRAGNSIPVNSGYYR